MSDERYPKPSPSVNGTPISRELLKDRMTTPRRCYTLQQVLALLQMSVTTFNTLKRRGALPFIDEILPRLGKHARYKAAPIDRYLDNQWGQSRSFSAHRRSA